MSESISTSITDGVATITLDRPEVLNALNPEMANGLKSATGAVATDEAVRCVVIKGAGEHFMAGGDPYRLRRAAHRSKLSNDPGKAKGPICGPGFCKAALSASVRAARVSSGRMTAST